MSDVSPFMKWPGGKRRVLKHIRQYLPTEFDTYYEPFLGGGAVLLDLDPKIGFVSDINAELINAYNIIKSDPTLLLTHLKDHEQKNSKEYFLAVRAWDRDEAHFMTLTDAEKAARTIYLNRTCFNGLYRVNSKNQFNAHYGDYVNPLIVDTDNLVGLNKWFNKHHITFTAQSYEKTLSSVTDNSFIYLDPPYIPASPTASFTSYTSGKFNMLEQQKVAEFAENLNEAGNMVLASNSDTELTRELYKDFIVKPINVTRSIGAGGHTRKQAGEVLLISPTLAEYLKIT